MVGNSLYFAHYTDAFCGTIIVDVGLLVRRRDSSHILFEPFVVDLREDDYCKADAFYYIFVLLKISGLKNFRGELNMLGQHSFIFNQFY